MMFTKPFWVDAAERAVKTGAQTLFAMFVAGVTILTIDWGDALAVTGTAVLASLLTSIVSTGVGDHSSASALASGGRHRKAGD